MKNLFIMFVTVLALCSTTPSLPSDFNKGMTALQNGDFETALKEWELLARNGDPAAQYNVGNLYLRGAGVLQDFAKAADWFTLAAENGLAQAQTNLGLLYFMGFGLKKDLVYAHMWTNIGAMNGSADGTKYRNAFTERMTATQLKKAQKLARECVKKDYKGC